VRVVCDRPTAVHVDGEDLGDLTEATVAAERDALTVLV
jgi:diacylglycerol kinase family enzyme